MQVGVSQCVSRGSINNGKIKKELMGDKPSSKPLTFQRRKLRPRVDDAPNLTATKLICSRFGSKSTSFDPQSRVFSITSHSLSY